MLTMAPNLKTLEGNFNFTPNTSFSYLHTSLYLHLLLKTSYLPLLILHYLLAETSKSLIYVWVQTYICVNACIHNVKYTVYIKYFICFLDCEITRDFILMRRDFLLYVSYTILISKSIHAWMDS